MTAVRRSESLPMAAGAVSPGNATYALTKVAPIFGEQCAHMAAPMPRLPGIATHGEESAMLEHIRRCAARQINFVVNRGIAGAYLE